MRKTAKHKLRLTDAMVAKLRHEGEGSRTRFWDATEAGLGLYIYSNGRRVWFVDYRTRAGRQRRMTLAEIKAVADARAAARRIKGAVVDGADPLTEKQGLRRGMTLAEYWETYLDHTRPRWKSRTAELYMDLWTRVLEPTFGRMKVETIKTADVATWHRRQKDVPGRANIALRFLKAILNSAVAMELIPYPSPASRVKPFTAVARERFLSPEEFELLWRSIETEEELGGQKAVERVGEAKGRGGKGMTEKESRGISRHTASLFRLLLLSGARLREVLLAKWDWIDWRGRALVLPDSKTGPKRLPLSAPAIEELKRLEAFRTKDCAYIIEGADGTGHLVNPTKAWQRVKSRAFQLLNERRVAAGLDAVTENPLENLRLHDCRHSFASVAVGAGLSLPIIGRALGHANVKTTERYSHLSADAGLVAADIVGAQIMVAVSRPAAVVEEISKEEAK